MTTVERPNPKIIHRATKIRADGAVVVVSAVCFKVPRKINLARENWTLVAERVTCPRCRKSQPT